MLFVHCRVKNEESPMSRGCGSVDARRMAASLLLLDSGAIAARSSEEEVHRVETAANQQVQYSVGEVFGGDSNFVRTSCRGSSVSPPNRR